jgi:dihydrofolate reductase
MALYIYIAQSLDGYIAGPGGNLDWLNNILNPTNDDFGFSNFIKEIDALVMGRHTFEMVHSFGKWPYTKPVYVVSSSLKSVPDELAEKAQIINASPAEIVQSLKNNGMSNLYIDGGSLIQSFISENLIDKFIITTVPVLLGGGVKLFGQLDSLVNLKFEKSEIILGQLVKNYYSR